MFTGYHVAEHGVRGESDRLEPGHTVFEQLADDGYATGVFSENPYLTAMDTGLSRGFDIVVGTSAEPLFPDGMDPQEYKSRTAAFLRDAVGHDRPLRSLANGVVSKLAWDYPWLLPDYIRDRTSFGVQPGSRYVDAFVSWLEGREGPWAACLNFMDTHHPYLPEAEYNRWDDGTIEGIRRSVRQYPGDFYAGREQLWKAESIRNLYDGTIRQVDAYVNQIVQELRSRDLLDQTLLIVTSDHGEGFGEQCPVHGIPVVGHNVGATEANLHVPLIVHWPESSGGRTVTDPVSTTDLPRAVAATRDERESDPLVTEGPTLACSSGIDAGMLPADHPRNGEERLKRDTHVLYESIEQGVEKVVFGDSPSRRLLERSSWQHTDRQFHDAVTLRDVSVRADRTDSTTAEVEQRLKHLGYR